MAWNCQFRRQGLPVSSLRTASFITENCQFHHKNYVELAYVFDIGSHRSMIRAISVCFLRFIWAKTPFFFRYFRLFFRYDNAIE
ncbi:MAG: hypothetical protein IJM43_05315 [Bacteroidaceae bacterium]|nr:hypothetical protein [Bacteroidaceae bacterium]